MSGSALRRIRPLGLEVYPKPKCCSKWLLPVCSSLLADELKRLNPNHPGNWEDADFDGCPTICYRLTGKQIRMWNKQLPTAVFAQLSDALGAGPAKRFFYDTWVRCNNIKATARNRWEATHGGIRHDRFDRGMGIRDAASLSIT